MPSAPAPAPTRKERRLVERSCVAARSPTWLARGWDRPDWASGDAADRESSMLMLHSNLLLGNNFAHDDRWLQAAAGEGPRSPAAPSHLRHRAQPPSLPKGRT